MKVSEQDIQAIVQSVLTNIKEDKPRDYSDNSTLTEIKPLKMKAVNHNLKQSSSLNQVNQNVSSRQGVFEKMSDAIEASDEAQKAYIRKFQLKDREKMIQSIRDAVHLNKEMLARLVFEESGIGNYEDKVAKHELIATKTPGTEDLTPKAISGDEGLTLIEPAPFGLIGAVTPVTNPSETIINNSIGMLAAGNAVVFNVHPSAKKASAYAVELINQAILKVGGPENLVSMVRNPTMDTLTELTSHPKVRLLVGTGGPGLVKTLLKSGKKAIGAGAGNPPVVVDETADVADAAESIITGASFDNNILCIAEKEVFVVDAVADNLIFHMLGKGAYMLDQSELNQIMNFALEVNQTGKAQGCSLDATREYHVSKKWVGKDAALFLNEIGKHLSEDIKLLICEVDFNHPFVQLEQMMPILPIVRVENVDEAIELAVKAEHGNRHTAVMHSKNVDHLTKFARAVETTIFVKNASSLAGVGFGGEGCTTMTIAGPTGEGVTSAETFTRLRRCVLAEGGFRIIG